MQPRVLMLLLWLSMTDMSRGILTLLRPTGWI
jgi:hypothetical protein